MITNNEKHINMSLELKTLKLEFDNPLPKVAKITVNRPSSLNALNSLVIQELDLAINEIEYRKKNIWVVLVTGAGDKAFIAGADISEMRDMTPVQARNFLYSSQQVLNRLENLPMPVIAAINGYALGGGFELALACDIRLASNTAVLGLPEVTLGLIPSAGGTQRLTKVIGISQAKYMILTGAKIDAERARGKGIVSEVYDKANFEAEVVKFIQKLLDLAPIALKAAKKSVNAALDEKLIAGLELELDKAIECFQTKDLREGMTAFLEKRKAEFSGQ